MSVCQTFNQILPNTDLHLCVNEHGKLSCIALPDLPVGKARARAIHDKGTISLAVMQCLAKDKDESYLVPMMLDEKQENILVELANAYNLNGLGAALKRHDWAKIIAGVLKNSRAYSDSGVCHEQIERIRVTDNTSYDQPDDFQDAGRIGKGVPIFLYAEPSAGIEMSRAELHRNLAVRSYLAEQNSAGLQNSLREIPVWANLPANSAFIGVLNRVEVELKLHSTALKPNFADVLLNPRVTEFVPGPPAEFRRVGDLPNAEGRNLGFTVTNWGDANVAHVALHVMAPGIQFQGGSIEKTITSPGTLIIKDVLGIHALKSWLFLIAANTHSLPKGTTHSIDELAVSDTPPIRWTPIHKQAIDEWWLSDPITQKVLWLATRYLLSHAPGDPQEVVCAVVPMGESSIQISLLSPGQPGVPYAFLVTRGNNATNALPVYASGTYEHRPDGSMVARVAVFSKHYIITAAGERVLEKQEDGSLVTLMFTEPPYAAVITGAVHPQQP